MLRLQGGNSHYVFHLQEGSVQRRVFGKITANSEREYRNLQYVTTGVPAGEMQLSRPIAVVGLPAGPLLLQEYLEGYSPLVSGRRLRYLVPGRTEALIHAGKTVLNTIYRIQQQFRMTWLPLSADDAAGIPNQPKAVGVFRQLETIQALAQETKKRIESRITSILGRNLMVRRGLIHGDLGLRNVLTRNGHISFIDWDYMQEQGFALLDPCYFAVILEMRSLQLMMSKQNVMKIDASLFDHIKDLEGSLIAPNGKPSLDDAIWFGKCLSLIDTLWWYEKDRSNYAAALLKQRGRQIDFLARSLEQEAVYEHD